MSKSKNPRRETPLDWHASPETAHLLPQHEDEPELTRMPLSRAIVKLAGPAIGSMLFIMIFNLVDAWWVSKLGAEPLAGISAASFIMWALQAIAMLISAGVNAMVARFVGSRDPNSASHVIGQAVLLAIFVALLNSAAGLFMARPTFRLMGLSDSVLLSAMDYMQVILYGLVFLYLAYTLDAAFRGTGDTRTPLKIIGVGLSINMILDPFLIFGIGPFPRLEAAGAGLATILAHLFIVVWAVIIIQRRTIHITFRPKKQIVDLPMMWRISKIGAPVAISGFLFSTSYMILTRIITGFGPSALAALGLGHRIEGLSYNVAVGFSFAASTLVGQNLGAQKPDRAEKSAWLNILYISIFLVFVSLLFYFMSEQIIRFFIDDPAVIAEGKRYLKIIAIFEVFLGFEIVLEGAFSGAGNTIPPMLISVPLTWARIPLALLFANTLNLGSDGVWWAISSTTALKGILMALWFKRGRWKQKEI